MARIAKESKTEAIRRALLERRERLIVRRANAPRLDRLRRVLENRIWPEIPAELLGRRISKEEREAILGYGPQGV